MTRYLLTVPPEQLTASSGTVHRFQHSLTFIGRDLDALAKYQLDGVTGLIDGIVARLQAVIDRVSDARAAAAAGATAAGDPNPYVGLVTGETGTLPPLLEGGRAGTLLHSLTGETRAHLATAEGQRRLLAVIGELRAAGPVPRVPARSAVLRARARRAKGAGGSTTDGTGGGTETTTTGVPLHPHITRCTPDPATPGLPLDILVADADLDGSSPTVEIGGLSAPVSSVGKASIRVTVPAVAAGKQVVRVVIDPAAPRLVGYVHIQAAAASGGDGSSNQTGGAGSPDTTPDPGDLAPDPAAVAALLRSCLGYVFEDRLRLTPAGFAVGEQVFALGLAPGEEVTLEQRSSTKRDVSLEDTLEEERQVETEASSVFTTELSDVLNNTTSVANKLDASHHGQAGASFQYGNLGINASASHDLSASLQLASSATATDSSKRTFQRTERTAARMRASHRTLFRVTQETRFEQTNRRVIRNPNRATPVTLQFFKILQRVDLSWERVGVRLAWAPFVKDPGQAVRARAALAGQAAADQASLDFLAPPGPIPPPAFVQLRETHWSPSVDLDGHFGFWNDMSTSVEVRIGATGMTWDGSPPTVILSFTEKRSASAYVEGVPARVGDEYVVRVHVGIDWTMGHRGDASVQVGMGLVNVESTDTQKQLTDFLAAQAEWQHESDDLKRQALKAAGLASGDARDQVFASYDPLTELLRNVVDSHFPSDVRDAFDEIELWTRVFDFDRAAYSLFTGVWRDGELPLPERPAADFLNASWARVYLPIRIGQEVTALRLAFGGALDPLDPAQEQKIAVLVDELRAYRVATFGSPDEVVLDPTTKQVSEQFEVLARWQETVPTDGTHCEAMLGTSSALDDDSVQAVSDAAALRQADLQARQAEVELRTKAMGQMAGSTSSHVAVVVRTEEEGDEPTGR